MTARTFKCSKCGRTFLWAKDREKCDHSKQGDFDMTAQEPPQKKKAIDYSECCGGVWSNLLQCYTGHLDSCPVWIEEDTKRKLLEQIKAQVQALPITKVYYCEDCEKEVSYANHNADHIMHTHEYFSKKEVVALLDKLMEADAP